MVDVLMNRKRQEGVRMGRVVLILLLAGLYGMMAHQGQSPQAAAIAVALQARPNGYVTAGSVIAYDVEVHNVERGPAAQVVIQLPYNAQQLTLVDASFESGEDWLSAVSGNSMHVIFGAVAGGQRRTATLRMRVAEGLAPGTVITIEAGYGWDDPHGGSADRSTNAVAVVVGKASVCDLPQMTRMNTDGWQLSPAQQQPGTLVTPACL